jgi:5-oxoprolinase (ATP-hydrolysing)
MNLWEFWIDVGGTFTDCIARSPDDDLVALKTLSSGATKGRVDHIEDGNRVHDRLRRNDPDDFWVGYELRFVDERGQTPGKARVTAFDPRAGILQLDRPIPAVGHAGSGYEIASGEGSPLLCIRRVLKLRLDDEIPDVVVKLGTTRGTNALLERKGARTAFITTGGFRDVLLIANQDRPRLFDLAVHKTEPLFERVVEINERLDATGSVLHEPDEATVRRQLAELKRTGVESIAICLLHSFANPVHEQLVERIAREVGFDEISTSSRLSPLIKVVSRGDTTVVDAYLNPVLRDYVERLRASLGKPQSALKIMTSAGGLVDADRFVGKDSMLSGPAGGVVGFSRVAQRAGFAKSIGFDMGGTSTDVSRFDGKYELEFETQKAGVRVVAPMLAIHTVAAGGGSICRFDGVKLAVGPESSGADPGPACYGRGGRLSVTDVNLALGRIVPSRFPFPLDRTAVEQRLQALCDEIADSPLGRRYTAVELADGFLKIANANMTRAIRRISVAKGYDPADYVLVTFGGAGAQHACAIAAAIGIRQILVHPFAGILSAYGIGLADVRRFSEHSVLKPYSVETLHDLEPLFEQLEQRTVAEVRDEGIPDDQIRPPLRSLDMRYAGVETTINVSYPTGRSPRALAAARHDPAALYQQLHQQLYGYTHDDRPIEITTARVEVVGQMSEPPVETVTPQRRIPKPAETTATWFDGENRSTGVYHREDLQAGDEITGPAIICEPTSTIVIDPEWSATLTERGEVLITQSFSRDPAPTEGWSGRASVPHGPSVAGGAARELSADADPVMLEIFNNLFASIAEQMGITLQQTSISTNVKERLDFSCAIFDPDGNLVVNAPHIPVHLGAMGETVRRIIADNPDMQPGDVYVTNDPYRGGSHLPDVTIITPVFDEDGGKQKAESGKKERSQRDKFGTGHWKLLFFTASRAHHAEIGGIVPGSMPPFSRNLAEEGVLIRNFKLVDAGIAREAELRKMLLSGPYPTRSIHDNLADVSAQVAANNNGVRLLNELVSRYTLPVVQAYMKHIQRAASAKMRMALAKIPDGVYSRTDHLDNGAPICVRITIQGETATVDFTGTGPPLGPVTSHQQGAGAPRSPQTGGLNLNANRAIVASAVLYVFRCLIAEDIPLNSGVLEPVEIILPQCLLNPPEHKDPAKCAAVVGGNVETSQRVVDTLLGALRVAAASQGTMNNLTFGDETFGYYETICGGSGATPDEDGASAVHTHMTNTRLTDAEVIERRYPVRVREFSIRRGSGGAGRRRGGDGIVRRLEFLKPLKVSVLSERRESYAPFGLQNGKDGALGRNLLQRAGSDELEDLGGKFAIDVYPGDVLTIETPGGGGYGPAD